MKKVIKNYIEWKHPIQARRLKIKKIERANTRIRVVYEYKPLGEGILSKKRETEGIIVDVWDIIEFVYYSSLRS